MHHLHILLIILTLPFSFLPLSLSLTVPSAYLKFTFAQEVALMVVAVAVSGPGVIRNRRLCIINSSTANEERRRGRPLVGSGISFLEKRRA